MTAVIFQVEVYHHPPGIGIEYKVPQLTDEMQKQFVSLIHPLPLSA